MEFSKNIYFENIDTQEKSSIIVNYFLINNFDVDKKLIKINLGT